MSEFAESNRRAWNEVHARRHEVYGAQVGMPEEVLARLEPLEGARVLHLQCATGEATAQLVARGARVTGLDISEEAVAIAARTVPDARFVAADVHALPDELRRRDFDLVVSESGVLAWLHDLDAWAGGIAAALRAGGRFALDEEHPVAQCLDDDLRWVGDYFDESIVSEHGWSHFELTGAEATETKKQRFWRLGQVLTALARAGLRVDSLDERPGSWRGTDRRAPGHFLLLATKT